MVNPNGFGAGSLGEDNLNQKTLEIAIHSHGCERWFLVAREKWLGGEIVACFKAPSDWEQAIPSTNPPNPPPF